MWGRFRFGFHRFVFLSNFSGKIEIHGLWFSGVTGLQVGMLSTQDPPANLKRSLSIALSLRGFPAGAQHRGQTK